ncbi:MAG TPA: biotin--[acetyl-CoA-carboxylase] ligase [Actinomycetes bacterium]|nr:biotin--[acetyl-CoA-carboxylase] ligase [Actinomycetes bacterium]
MRRHATSTLASHSLRDVPLYGVMRPDPPAGPQPAGDPLEAAARRLPAFFAPVEIAASLPSTMVRAAELAERGRPEGATVLADHQTSGRGRLGRAWLAPPGSSLLVSVVLRPVAARVWPVLVAAGLALVEAVGEVLGQAGAGEVEVALKWPNDLLVGGRKAAGLLAEAAAGALVLGMGVNVRQERFPPELRGRVTSLALAAGRPVSRAPLLAAWGRGFVARYQAIGEHPGALLPEYRACLATLGQRVRVQRLAGPPLTGRAVDVRQGGALVVRLDGGDTVEVAAGDVEHLRPAAPADRPPG